MIAQRCLCRSTDRPISGDADGIESGVDSCLIAGHNGHAEALHQKRPGLDGPEVGAGDEQQIIIQTCQLSLGKGNDLAWRHVADAEIIRDA